MRCNLRYHHIHFWAKCTMSESANLVGNTERAKTKTRALNQGMMQEILTGKTWLV